MQKIQAVKVIISGQVQGVFYRVFIKQEAEKLGLSGWVRNLVSGQVEAVFEGSKTNIEKIINLCKKGSPGSRVEKINIINETLRNLKTFEILR